jgi:hypothetical protein
MPGIVDTHPHVVHFGLIEGPLVDLKDAASHAEIVARIAGAARTTPKGEWIMTTPVGEPHYFLRRSWRDLAEGGCRTATSSTAPRTDHPVWIQAWAPVIPNVCAFNSAALARLGLERDTPDQIEHVWIEKDASGEPTGILRGSVTNYYTGDRFMNSLLCQLPLLRCRTAVAGMARAQAMYAAHGRDDGVRGARHGRGADRPSAPAPRRGRPHDARAGRAGGRALRDAVGPAVPDRRGVPGAPRRGAHARRPLGRRLPVDGVTISRGGRAGRASS